MDDRSRPAFLIVGARELAASVNERCISMIGGWRACCNGRGGPRGAYIAARAGGRRGEADG
jgi:hypothetical protein